MIKSRLNSRIGSNVFRFNVNGDYNKATAWNDWFTSNNNTIIANNYSSQIIVSNNLHVLLCVFINILSSISTDPGPQNSISLCIEECSFLYCSGNYDGGAINFIDGINFVMNKICAYHCYSIAECNGQFCYIQDKYGSAGISIAHQLSVCECAPYDNSDQYSSICFYYGNVSLDNVNSSANRCGYYSGCLIADPSTSNVAKSTFSNNTDDSMTCIYFWLNIHQISQCNIIQNQIITSGIATIYSSAITTLSDSIIDMNTGATNTVCAWSDSVTLIHCFLQSNNETFGIVNIQSPISDSNTRVMNHFKSHMCFALTQDLIPKMDQITARINYFDSKTLSNIFRTNLIIGLYYCY